MSENILQEADRLTSGDRGADYGHPLDDYTRTAALWSPILGIDVTPEQAQLCMIQVKVSRECNKHKRDNLADIAGYARTLEMTHEEREKRDPAKPQNVHPDQGTLSVEDVVKASHENPWPAPDNERLYDAYPDAPVGVRAFSWVTPGAVLERGTNYRGRPTWFVVERRP